MNSPSHPVSSNTKADRVRSTLQPDGSILVQHVSSRRGPVERTPNSPLSAASVAEIMTPNVLCVSPDVELESLVALLIERGISGVPVVNERGLPIGIVSKTDIIRRLYENGPTAPSDGATAGDLMLPIAFTLLESAPLSHAAALMAWEGVHRIPICSDAGDVIGILSSLDVVRWLSREVGYPVRRGGAVSAPLVDGSEGSR